MLPASGVPRSRLGRSAGGSAGAIAPAVSASSSTGVASCNRERGRDRPEAALGRQVSGIYSPIHSVVRLAEIGGGCG